MMRIKEFLFASLILFSIHGNAQYGALRGMVFDGATGEFLPGVTVLVEGTSSGTITDLDGNFNLSVQPGTYNLRLSFISYETLTITDVPVEAGEVNHLGELKLEEATIALNEVIITAKQVRNTETALISIKRRSPNVLDGISSGTLKIIGDSDVAGAMKRVPGVSVAQGKYVYVRGLGDRYTKSLLNGVDVPGLDPDRNTMQMDIFPTSVIDNIIVHKTFSADLPADFTGGAVDIEIKDFPDKKEMSFSMSSGYNPGSHFNSDYLSYDGGKTDFLGFDDGTRAIPATENIPQFAEVVGNPDGEKGQRYKDILHGFNPHMAAVNKTSLADLSLGMSYGDQKVLEKATIGYNMAISYKNETDFYENAEYGKYGLADPDTYEMNRREYQVGNYGENNVLISGMAGLAIKTNKMKIRMNLLHLQNGSSKAGIFDFTGSDQGSDFLAYQHGLDYSQRALSHLLLDGKHKLMEGQWEIEWKVSNTFSQLEDPDIRFTRYEKIGGDELRIGTEVGFPERIWRDLNEINSTGLVNFTREFKFNGNTSKLHFGALTTFKNRNYIIRNFSINPRGDYELTGDPDELFREENLWVKDGNVGLGTTYETPFIPNNPNQFNASVLNTAGYVSTQLAVFSTLKAIIGLRVENFLQYYSGTDQLRRNVLQNELVLSDLGFFPSVNFLYSITGDQNLRLSYTKTIARPSFKELSYAEIYDPISGITFIGSFHPDGDDLAGVEYWDGNLVSTDIQNYDLRWELFGKGGQLISASIFYKMFKNPIEIVQYTKQVGTFQPRNVGDGQSFGVEFEFRKNLGFINEELSALKISTNVTLNKSSIAMSDTEYRSRTDNARIGQEINLNRTMSGQAPYLINCGLSYTGGREGFWQRLEAGLFYNVQGSTLEYVGAADRPDIYTNPFNSMNFNTSFKLGAEKNLVLGFRIKNILNARHELVYKSFRAADQYFERWEPGTTYTFRLAYKF